MIKRFVWIVCFVLGGASLGWADSATRPATQPVADEKPLGRLGDYESVKIIVVSDDENRVAFVGVRGQQQWVVRDGVPAGPYDWVIPRSVAMSPGGSRCAFIVQTASQTIAVVDGKPCAPCYGIGQNRVLLPRYGKRFAYVAIGDAGKGASMVADGINGPTFDDVQWPLFSPDGVHLAYGAKQGKQQMIVLDGHPQKAYDSIAEYSLVFSRDSRRLAYRAVVAGKTVMVCDQTESKPYDLMRLGPGFSPDSMHLAGVVEEHGKTFAVIDGAEGRPYDGLLTGDFTFSPDSKHVAYAMKLGQKNLVIRDGVDQEQFDAVGNSTVSFSDDSRHLVYEGVNLGKSSIVFDNQKLDAFDGALMGTPVISPDSTRVLFAADREAKWVIVLWDGHQRVEGGAFQSILTPRFSPDSRRFSYRCADGSKFFAVVDGVISPPMEAIGSIVFSPDSKHYAYMCRRAGHPKLVIDGIEASQDYDARLSGELPVFDANDSLHMLVLRDDRIIRVGITL